MNKLTILCFLILFMSCVSIVNADPPAIPTGGSGWEMVSIPVNVTVPKWDVNISNDDTGVVKTWNESVTAGWITTWVYFQNVSWGNYQATDYFFPWHGHWIYSYENITLQYDGVGKYNLTTYNVTAYYNTTVNVTNMSGGSGSSAATKGLFAGSFIIGTTAIGVIWITKHRRNSLEP